ncbi:hypothetical protein I4U23_031069 [Adineta vaga]|nr:hypothetical protein I4U23_031069 [Adineta vaga]
MYTTYIFLSIILIIGTSGISFPYIQDVYLQSTRTSNPNVTTYFNSTCQDCLCEEFITYNRMNFIALNCLSNETCQFFSNFPSSYQLTSSNGSRLYFLQSILPNDSSCCMPNITELLSRLKNTIAITIDLTFQPGGLNYDPNIPSEVAVVGWGSSPLFWFDPQNMTTIRSVTNNVMLTITSYNNHTFTAVNGIPTIHIRDRQTNTYLGNISYPTLTQIRKIIFINDRKTMIVSTQDNRSLTLFNVHSLTNYTFQRFIELPYSSIHGIAKVNDTFLYVSTWVNKYIISCKYENSIWTHRLLVNNSITAWGSHLTVDECGRIWFINNLVCVSTIRMV